MSELFAPGRESLVIYSFMFPRDPGDERPCPGGGRTANLALGDPRHFWGSELFYAPTDEGQDPRHAGTIEPLWNLFDLTREGRPTDWEEQLVYR